jgi:hypothetical protein
MRGGLILWLLLGWNYTVGFSILESYNAELSGGGFLPSA